MEDPHKSPPLSPDIKNVLPDVVHSQQIPALGTDLTNETSEAVEVNVAQSNETNVVQGNEAIITENSETESISEHIPSRLDFSLSASDNLVKPDESQHLLNTDVDQEKISKCNSLNIPYPQSSTSDHQSVPEPSPHSSSWPTDAIPISDVHHISAESPVNLALSSEQSKLESENKSECDNKSESLTPQFSVHESEKESSKSEFPDSLNEEKSLEQNNDSLDRDPSIEREDSLKDSSSGSEEIIKLDIRGTGVPRFPFQAEKIIFGPVPEGSNFMEPSQEQMPLFKNLLSPFLVGTGDIMAGGMFNLEEDVTKDEIKDVSEPTSENSFEEKDLLVEEVLVDETKTKSYLGEHEQTSIPTQPKSYAPEETGSFSTMNTDYKTICEEYHGKLVHLEAAIAQRDELIEELTVSLQRSVKDHETLKRENEHLGLEVQNLQHLVCEQSQSEHDTIKAQLSDLVKYESMLKDESTKFYSAIMSSGSSAKSSVGERDKDQEEVTVNYSRSDLKSSDSSDEFQVGFEAKLSETIGQFEECMEENVRNKLRESVLQVFCDEVGKLRIEYDTDLREIESQYQQEKHLCAVESRRLRELLASVKSGNADIELLRKELATKHEKEMENLRTYFEKKCSDMERSYSEEVWRGRCGSGAGSHASLEGREGREDGGEGDVPRRRARSADLTNVAFELDQPKSRLRPEDEHLAQIAELQARHKETVAALEGKIKQLKANLQTAENTESNVSLYQQDIDLELEKGALSDQTVEMVRQEVIQQLQEQIQVLLSDPDAELSSWPLELVALRDKIHGDAKSRDEKELSSLRDELSGCETDKWKQRRNLSFDQNRQIEEVTKERDGLKRVALTLQHVVSQLVAYCVAAEDELNKTVLAELLAHVLPHTESVVLEADSPSSTADASGSLCLDTSALSRSKHVHFAPDLRDILAELDEDDLVGYLEQQRDLSVDIKRELENSLLRLRHEAQELLELSAKVGRGQKPESELPMLEAPGQVRITELVEVFDRQRVCEHCDDLKKSMEEAMSECVQRENILRSELDAALTRIAHLMNNTDLIAEGYGLVQQPSLPLSLPVRGEHSRSLSGEHSPSDERSLRRELEQLHRERDDFQQQLEAANRQLRSTRQFVEEQATERETERDEFAKRERELRDENARLAVRLQNNARILNEMHCLKLTECHCRAHDAHVEQLETQTREMNQTIADLEQRKAATDEELKATIEKISLLRDIIANLESQLEQKSARESEILGQLSEMRSTIDERDSKMRALLGELESLKGERENSEVICPKCAEDDAAELVAKIEEQARQLEGRLDRGTAQLERVHEVCSATLSERSEDVSVRDRAQGITRSPPAPSSPPSPCTPLSPLTPLSPRSPRTPRTDRHDLLRGVWRALETRARAQEMVLKRIADLEMQRDMLKDVAQEVRAERDVLQARMSEQALRISSLGARLEQHRHNAEALAHDATSQLTVKLHDSVAEVQRLKEELDARDKQLTRLKQSIGDKEKINEPHDSQYGNTSCNSKDKVIILERELASAQSRVAQLESLARSLELDKEELGGNLRDCKRVLAEKQTQLDELLALKLDDDLQKSEPRSENNEGKTSARTLSDIVSISDFDEQDLQMRRAELKGQNLNISGAPYVNENRDKSLVNRTLPPEAQRPNMSSLNVDLTDHFDMHFTPRADSLPLQLTSTQNRDFSKQYKRNVNETTVFGGFGDSVKHSTAQKIPDNCSMYPNRDVNDTKNLSVEPKKIDFSLEPSHDNRNDEFTSLGELGLTLDIRQENFPDILTQLKHEIKRYKSELNVCKSELKQAAEQLCEFPALKEEVEELKSLLENTMATMDNDKKFYENQLDQFSSNKNLLEQRLAELTQEVNDKSKDLHLLKEDILRRENMILELAKEKRNLTNKMAELEVKIDELQGRNSALEKYESETHQLREKASELQKLEQLVTEKNQQIDSLNQHLDRFDNLQRCLNNKTEQLDNLKEALEEKTNELYQMQDTVEALNRDLANVHEDNEKLDLNNKELKLKLTKLEKEQDNQSLKLKSHESELERVNSLNDELSSKIDDLKQLTNKLKDKQTEVEILNEDINAFHEEIASLKEQLKLGSRSPSPRSKNEDKKPSDRQASNDKKQLVKIRKQISLMQHELDFNKKELNDKAFELAKSKLDITELKSSLSQAQKLLAEKEDSSREAEQQALSSQQELQQLRDEKAQLELHMKGLVARIREESNVGELKQKLREKTEQCLSLEREINHLKDAVERPAGGSGGEGGSGGRRSPTAELERALQDQLCYSHRLDQDIMEQILSASSDNEEIPRLALNSSKSSSSIYSSSSERAHRLKSENDSLRLQVDTLQARLKDKDALITELNRIRDKLVQEWQSAKLRLEAERDNSARLQLLLDTHKETSESLQNQDTNMIQILKKRLESAMSTELELQQSVQLYKSRVLQLERQLAAPDHELTAQNPVADRLQSELTILRSKLESERSRYQQLQAQCERQALLQQRHAGGEAERARGMRGELLDLRRLKHESGVELIRAKELISIQASTIAELERKLAAGSPRERPGIGAMSSLEDKCDPRDISSLQSPHSARVTCVTQERQADKLAPRDERRPDHDQAIRYLHGRCLRLESCRKALVWQKRYLQRVIAGYTELENKLRLPGTKNVHSAGRSRFRCIASVVIIVIRMGFLVRRRQQVRSLSAGCLLRYGVAPSAPAAAAAGRIHTPTSQYQPSSPPSRDQPAPPAPSGRHTDSLARRALKHDLRLNLPHSPSVGDLNRSPYYNIQSPINDPFMLNSPRGETAAAYLNKLELVSRCLAQTMEATRDAQ